MNDDHDWRFNKEPHEKHRDYTGWVLVTLLVTIVLIGLISRDPAKAGHIIDGVFGLLMSDLPN